MAGSGLSKTARQGGAGVRPAAAARLPRQARGQARVDAILDAAAALVAEEGLAGVTMHALSLRARTSVGSLYHFFPDRDSVIEALRRRHSAATREISRQLGEAPASAWRELSATAAIERLVTPFVEYMRRHADFLPLMGGRLSKEDDADFVRVMRQVLQARLPALGRAEREDYALMLHVIASGAMHAGLQADPGRVDLYLREIPRVLAAYLAAVEAGAPR